MLTTQPLLALRWGRAAWLQYIAALRLSWTSRSHLAGSIFASGTWPCAPPALLIRMSIRPNSATTASISAWHCSGLRTSVCTASARRPVSRMRVCRFVDLVLPPPADRHIRAALGQQDRGGAADAGARAGDHGDAAGEVEFGGQHHQRLRRWQPRTRSASSFARSSGVTTGVSAGRCSRRSASLTRVSVGVGQLSQSYQRP